MADDKRLQSLGFDGHWILRMSGYAAAAAFCAVSLGANLQYGLSLGKNPIDKATYAVASIAADVFKIAAPLLALSLWSKRFHILAIVGLVLWLGCVGWSMASAVGFVLSSRGEAIADRVAEAATRHGWEAKVERAETQLATLGRHRPVDVIKAELASVPVSAQIWRRSRHCADLVREESRLACAPVLDLRKELAAAEAAERLETQLVAGRAQLATVAVAGSVADPQASALARLIGADEATIRTSAALLLAGLIEVGSALGFTLVSVATARNLPPPSAPRHVPGPANAARRHANAQHAVVTHANECRVQAGAVATACNPSPLSDPEHVPGPANTPRRHANAQHAVVTHANECRVQAGAAATACNPSPLSDPEHVPGPANTARRQANAQPAVVTHVKEYLGPAGPVATAHNPPQPSSPQNAADPANTARQGTNWQHAIVTRANERRVRAGHLVDAAGNTTEHRFGRRRWHVPPLRSPTHAPGSEARRDANTQPTRWLKKWIQARLQVDATGHIPAREAYADFCRWARAMDVEPCTETRFGREFSARIVKLGGLKVKRRDRAYYNGMSLSPAASRMATHRSAQPTY